MARKTKSKIADLLSEDKDLLKTIIQTTVQEILEAEMTNLIGAAPYERSSERRGHRR